MPVGFVGLIHASELDVHLIIPDAYMDPTRRFTFGKYIADRRQVDHMNAAGVFFDGPMVSVPVDISFNLLPRTNHFHQGHRIF